MSDALGYEGKQVVMTGAATGMGAAAAELLVELGAEVFALDIADVKAPVHRFLRTDMKNRESIDSAIAELPEEIDVLFNCAGVPHPPASAFDTMMINFVGLRHLTDTLLPRVRQGGAVSSIASTAGMAWKPHLDRVRSFLALETFEAGETVSIDVLRARGLVKKNAKKVKILGHGDLAKALTLQVQAISSSARAKIEAASGSVES